MKGVIVAVLAAVLVASAAGGKVSFSGDVVVSCGVGNATEAERIVGWAEGAGADVWAVTDGRVDVRVAAGVWAAEGRRALAGCGVAVADVGVLAEAAEAGAAKGVSGAADGWFDDYHSFDDIVAWYEALADKYPHRVSFQASIGQSVEGRDIPAVRISGDGPTPVAERKQVYMQGLQHAREWIGGATVQYIAYQLATGAEYAALLAETEVVIVPVVNPDGYEYTWTTDRLWRKNRRRNSDGSYGVDLNRNWDDHWGGTGTSHNPSSDTYCGTGPFSEPETLAVSDFIQQNARIVAILDVHAYSQLVLGPYGWTSDPPKHDSDFRQSGNFQAAAIEQVHGKVYTSMPSHQLYPTTGSTGDWAVGHQLERAIGRLTYGFTWEMRPATANPGFLLPPREIVPTGEEAMQAFVVWAELALFKPM